MKKQQPKKEYHTNWFFKDNNDLDQLIYRIAYKFLQDDRYDRQKESWARYFVSLYLLGMRRAEPFYSNPTITKMHETAPQGKPIVMYYIQRTNAKHIDYKKAKDGAVVKIRKPMNALLPPASNFYEAALWDFLTDKKERAILNFDSLKSNRQLYNVTHAFEGRFKADITNGNEERLQVGISPHMLRHARAYDLHINKGLNESTVVKIFGWLTPSMLYYYEDIANQLSLKKVKEEYMQKYKDQIFNFNQVSIA
jgi:hypothetical protein